MRSGGSNLTNNILIPTECLTQMSRERDVLRDGVKARIIAKLIDDWQSETKNR